MKNDFSQPGVFYGGGGRSIEYKDRMEIFKYCNELLKKHEKENRDSVMIEDYFGSEIMEPASKKYVYL